MSNSRSVNCEKAEITGATIGFRFHANDEELEEVQSKDFTNDKNNEKKTDNSAFKNAGGAKAVADNKEPMTEPVRDPKHLLGKRSISVDSAYESPFSNPIETWKKLNVLKEKITKTVEEKILEMKTDKNHSSKSGCSKLVHSKESSSISDSEDNSESSRRSEQSKDAENQISLSDKTPDNNAESPSDGKILETDKKEKESELRNRKSFTNTSDLVNLTEIKIAVARTNTEGSAVDLSLSDDVESGVEADENLDATEDESVDFFDGETVESGGGGSTNPPSGGRNIILHALGILTSTVIPQYNAVIFFLGFTLYFFFPLSDFFRGFLLSLLLIVFWGSVKSYVHVEDGSLQQRAFVMPDYNSMPPLKVPESKPVKGIWFNEYEGEMYDPDYYSVTQTVPAYLEIEDNTLKISRPKGKIRRRATYDEPEYKLQIISQRIYDISGCNVYLMPDGLTRKRLFSKKYPIVIYLRPNSLISEKKQGKTEEKELHQSETADNSFLGVESPKYKSMLYLFARCDRQKEEWYRRLLSATKLPGPLVQQKIEKISDTPEEKEKETEKSSTPQNDTTPKEPGTPFENIFFDDEIAQIDEYYRYMAKFVNVEIINEEVKVQPPTPPLRKSKLKKKDSHGREFEENHINMKNFNMNPLYKKPKSSPASVNLENSEEKEQERTNRPGNQVQWFSAFVNRILFDVFRSPYWLDKIQNKVQKKLNSIRLPYYIEDIEVIEMDLGKTGPMFHRVSQPYIDDRGLWFDMDVTFDGFIKLTIQTHLNLIKLQKGIEENEALLAEKQKKGKKKQRVEKESKDSFLIKESKVKIKDTLNQTKEIKGKTCKKPCLLKSETKVLNSEQLNSDTENCSCKTLIDEVTKLVEIAVEESLTENIEKQSEPNSDCPCPKSDKERSPIYDSELEDSAESSDEDDEEDSHPLPQTPVTEEQPPETLPKRYPKNRRSSKKIFKVFENVAQSKYFRSMAQSKYIQKAIAGVSAAKLRLTLEIKGCTGVLAVNIPPPPSDRFWYGFREMPTLIFSANPKIGDKAVRFVHIKNYLQKKILHELKKVMVSPNMIDFVLPTSAPARSSSSLQIEDSDLQEATLSE